MSIRPKIVMTDKWLTEDGQVAHQEKTTYWPPWWQWPGWWLLHTLLMISKIAMEIALEIKRGVADVAVNCFTLTESKLAHYSERKD